jgi:hypothetical protein
MDVESARERTEELLALLPQGRVVEHLLELVQDEQHAT